MKAIVQERFGPPDVLHLVDTDLPKVGADDVLVRVHAAALNPYDWHILRGDPLVARLMGVGLTKPKARVAGVDAAGVVEAVGANVRGLQPGDEVLGFCRGAFAEYACAAADMVVIKPAGLTFEQAAAVPIAATTALRGIRDVGQVKAGQRVLVNGAGGGVGTYAVHVRRVGAQGGHDLAAVGVPGDDRGAVLEVQHLAQPGDVVGQGGHRELRGGDVVTAGLQPLDDTAPAGAIGPRAVDQDNVGSSILVGDSFRGRVVSRHAGSRRRQRVSAC